MAKASHLKVLSKGVEAWNKWRNQKTNIRPDLSEANLAGASLVNHRSEPDEWDVYYRLSETNPDLLDLPMDTLSEVGLRRILGPPYKSHDWFMAHIDGIYLVRAHLYAANLSEADLRKADLSRATVSRADLSGAKLSDANLSGADLTGTNLSEADLYRARLFGANLSGANLTGASLYKANLSEADLRDADLRGANLRAANLEYCILVRTDLRGSLLTSCPVYGLSAWDVHVSDETDQTDLLVTPTVGTPTLRVDNLEVAQFVHMLHDNRKIRNVIETMTSKVVLILGNFTPQRKEVLEAIRERLRGRGYVPILYDFEGPRNKNLIETVTTVGHLSRFVIADITQPRSVPAELEALVPALPSLPIQPLIENSEKPYAMFVDLLQRDSVLKVHHYTGPQDLLDAFDEEVLAPAERKHTELEVARLRAIEEKL